MNIIANIFRRIVFITVFTSFLFVLSAVFPSQPVSPNFTETTLKLDIKFYVAKFNLSSISNLCSRSCRRIWHKWSFPGWKTSSIFYLYSLLFLFSFYWIDNIFSVSFSSYSSPFPIWNVGLLQDIILGTYFCFLLTL